MIIIVALIIKKIYACVKLIMDNYFFDNFALCSTSSFSLNQYDFDSLETDYMNYMRSNLEINRVTNLSESGEFSDLDTNEYSRYCPACAVAADPNSYLYDHRGKS